MVKFRSKRTVLLSLFALLGLGYFGAFSWIDLNPVVQNYLALLPVQIGVLIYLLWWRRSQASLPRSPKDDPEIR